MSIINKLFLYLIMLPSALWRALGADTAQLKAILHVRLMLDYRKPVTTMGRQRKQKKNGRNGTLVNMFLSTLMGVFYMFPVLYISDRISSLTIFFSLLLFLLSLMLITDFSNVLFDTRDKFILFPRPVNDRTLVLSRLLHVFIYLARIVLPMSLPCWIALGIMDGWKSAVLFPVPLMLMVLIALFIVNGIFLIVLKLSKPEKFKEVINYFQIATSVVFFAMVYLLPRAFTNNNGIEFDIKTHAWLHYLPSYWLASCWSWLGYTIPFAGTELLSILAVVLPLACLLILVKWLAPSFTRNISGIDASDITERKAGSRTKSAPKNKLYQKLAYMFNSTDDARAGFMITWLQTARSRSFRMRVLPTFAFIPVYFVYILTSKQTSFGDAFQHIADKPRYILLLYMSSFVIRQALNYLSISEQYKAAWVYYATPVETPGRIMIGAFKAMWLKYFFPFFAALSIFVLYIWGGAVILDIILALVNITLFALCVARVSFRYFPFSLFDQMNQGGNRIIKGFLTMSVPAFLGFGHYFALNFLPLKIAFLILSSIALWLVWSSYAATSWGNLQKAEADL